MIELNIPGRTPFTLKHLVLDINGTLSLDGYPLPGVAERIAELRETLHVHLLTADTFGKGKELAEQLQVGWSRMNSPGEDEAKATFVNSLGAESVVAIGNGANDVLMLRAARLGIVVLGPEATAATAIAAADVVARDITTALDLLRKPKRLLATLRK